MYYQVGDMIEYVYSCNWPFYWQARLDKAIILAHY